MVDGIALLVRWAIRQGHRKMIVGDSDSVFPVLARLLRRLLISLFAAANSTVGGHRKDIMEP